MTLFRYIFWLAHFNPSEISFCGSFLFVCLFLNEYLLTWLSATHGDTRFPAIVSRIFTLSLRLKQQRFTFKAWNITFDSLRLTNLKGGKKNNLLQLHDSQHKIYRLVKQRYNPHSPFVEFVSFYLFGSFSPCISTKRANEKMLQLGQLLHHCGEAASCVFCM